MSPMTTDTTGVGLSVAWQVSPALIRAGFRLLSEATACSLSPLPFSPSTTRW